MICVTGISDNVVHLYFVHSPKAVFHFPFNDEFVSESPVGGPIALAIAIFHDDQHLQLGNAQQSDGVTGNGCDQSRLWIDLERWKELREQLALPSRGK